MFRIMGRAQNLPLDADPLPLGKKEKSHWLGQWLRVLAWSALMPR